MSWNVILWACTWTQRRGFRKTCGDGRGLLCRHESCWDWKRGNPWVHFAGIWWSNISEICVSRCVFFLKLFSDVPHFSRTKLGCTSPNKAARHAKRHLPTSVLQLACIETPCPKKIKAPKIWRYSVEVHGLCMHIFSIVFISQIWLYWISHKVTNLWGQNLGQTWRCKGEEGTGG